MANIPMYDRVQTEADLQNLVTGIVLRQQEPFTEEEIRKQVMEKLHGSYFENEEETVKEKVARTIHFMWLGGHLRPANYPQTPTKWKNIMSFPAYNPGMINLSKSKSDKFEEVKKKKTPKKQNKKK